MSNVLPLLVLSAVLLCCSGILVFTLGRRMDRVVPVSRRLDQKMDRRHLAQKKAEGFSVLKWGLQLSQRAGLELHPMHLVLAVAFFILVSGGAFISKGGLGLLISVITFAIAVYILILWRSAATQRKLLQQLPGFIDQIIRIMAIGRSFDSALLQAIQDSPPPLSKALESVVIENTFGGDLVESLTDTANIYRINELQMITLALKINQRYGGSIKAMLESIITLIRQREQAERELQAMTGETRVSAWLLGCMPIAIVGYMMVANPAYIGYLLSDPNGDAIIYTALGLQVTGGLILWHMLRSVR